MKRKIRAVDRHPSPECRELGTGNLVCLALTRRRFLIAEDYFSLFLYHKRLILSIKGIIIALLQQQQSQEPA
jgi:hypothetical protein